MAAMARTGSNAVMALFDELRLDRATLEQVIPHEYLDSQNSPIAEVKR
jgi:hypothetical protein